MAPLKAPGPDGIPPLFYQNFWSLVGSDVTTSILHYLNTGSLPTPLNHTFITLIPKTKNPERVVWSAEWSWISDMQGSSVKGIFRHAFAENKDVELLAFMGWAVWNRRNQLRFNENACPLNQLLP
ncbi:hypothetical protein SO802_015102 [Lithocarpus litseifolius]|uniref:Reverse transcriptase zinc-binding domain-containing protein n=1 Tax=Lithocarpus litseifolius TaxID=425828 RepID=A0AAW2CWB9_9ROSI